MVRVNTLDVCQKWGLPFPVPHTFFLGFGAGPRALVFVALPAVGQKSPSLTDSGSQPAQNAARHLAAGGSQGGQTLPPPRAQAAAERLRSCRMTRESMTLFSHRAQGRENLLGRAAGGGPDWRGG